MWGKCRCADAGGQHQGRIGNDPERRFLSETTSPMSQNRPNSVSRLSGRSMQIDGPSLSFRSTLAGRSACVCGRCRRTHPSSGMVSIKGLRMRPEYLRGRTSAWRQAASRRLWDQNCLSTANVAPKSGERIIAWSEPIKRVRHRMTTRRNWYSASAGLVGWTSGLAADEMRNASDRKKESIAGAYLALRLRSGSH